MDKKTYYIMTAIIAILCCIIGCFIGSRYVGRIDKDTNIAPVVTPSDDTTKTTTEDTTPTVTTLTNADVVGVYQYDFKENGNDRYLLIDLYSNGTYRSANDNCGEMAGKYEIVGDKIKMEDVIYYECDICFHTKNSYMFGSSFKTYEATIKDNKLTVNGTKTVVYTKVSSNPGDAPTNLLTPVDDGDFHKDCSNLKNK